MKQILITGGTGVLGRELRPLLGRDGHNVRIMSRSSRPGRLAANEEWAQADLAAGAGLDAAVHGVDTIIHAASRPGNGQVDVAGTERLLRLAEAAGVGQFIFISIVGIEQIPFSYYRHKLEAERLVQASQIPGTILRATQFHNLVDRLMTALARLPVVLLPAGWKFQPVSETEVAAALAAAVKQEKFGRLPDIAGPQILSMDEIARPWLAAQSRQKKIWHLPLPGKFSAALQQGYNTVPNPAGQIGWEAWLTAHYGSRQSREKAFA